eukprot:TRINITY_DN2231_c0_g1_i1.p1 TRINITY_DN2231_c0_g1~~TRINITY_DN2231_c0_g1_i1.p1  ORF type:complete len:443 (+),score=123.47 TRINITY_DN2231_c0_g1_i1:81-1331(+)
MALARFRPASDTVYGVGAAKGLGKLVKEAAPGVRRVVIVTDKGIVQAGVAAQVEQALRKHVPVVTIFDGVEPDPPFRVVLAGCKEIGNAPGTCIVALGGGSTIDAAKAMMLVCANGGHPRDYCRYVEPSEKTGRIGLPEIIKAASKCRAVKKTMPLIAVPTTSGTGSETNGFGVLTDEGNSRKVIFGGGDGPTLVVLDPELAVGAPRSVTAACAFDVMTHAIEAMMATPHNPFGDAQAMAAIRLVHNYLPKVLENPKDVDARGQVMAAANLAGTAFKLNGGLGLVHAMGHGIGAKFHVAHGQTLATLLPYVMEFNLPKSAPAISRVAEALQVYQRGASDADNARRAIDCVTQFAARVGVGKGLADLGGTEQDIPWLAQQALRDVSMWTTPRYPTKDEVEGLYRAALRFPGPSAAKL